MESAQVTIENVVPLIKDYEVLIKTLTEQLDYYKKQQDVLRNDIVVLLDENKKLSSYTKELLEKTDQTINSMANKTTAEGDIIENLKQQISMLTAEKESTMELWRTSLTTIDHLEEELRLYEGRVHGYIPKEEVKKIIIKYEKVTKQLEGQIKKVEAALSANQQTSASDLNQKQAELNRLNDYYQKSLATIKNLEEKLVKLKTENQTVKDKNSELEKRNHTNTKIINDLRQKESQSKSKVTEAVYVVEAALMEKDAALLREQKIQDEMIQISNKHSKELEILNEKHLNDLESSKVIYTEALERLKLEMKKLQNEISEKTSELEVQKKAMIVLEDRFEKFKTSFPEIGNTNKLLILEKNLEQTFQKLLLSERRNIQLEAEKESIKGDVTQMSCLFERELKAKEVEKRVLETKVATLQNELETGNSNVIDMANKVAEINRKILIMESEVKKQLVLNDIKHEKLLANKIREIEDANSRINHDLQIQLQAQIDFNLKWKEEVKEFTRKLEERVRQLKEELKVLKEKNRELSWQLSASEKQVETYRTRLVGLCVDVKKIATVSREHSSHVLIEEKDEEDDEFKVFIEKQ